MPNPVDDIPLGPGHIALPLDPDEPSSAPNLPSRFAARTFHRRVLYVIATCCALLLLAVWIRPPESSEDLSREIIFTDIAEDPRLQSYESPDDAEYCGEWLPQESSGSASTAFLLPIDADLLFFLSRGPLSGQISIVETANYTATGPIEVNITARYREAADLEKTRACRMGGANEHGLLLWADGAQDVRLNITVALPSGVRGYKDLSTDLPRFSHTTGNFYTIWSSLSFGIIRFKTSDAPINFVSMSGLSAFMQTSNAKVEGFFNGLDGVAVQTSNAAVDLTAIMYGKDTGSESQVNITTSNGPITANLGLVSDYDNAILRATARTSNAALTIHAPSRTMLAAEKNVSFFLDASTSKGAAAAYLFSAYEGAYDLWTTRSKAQVEGVKDLADPLGKGRRRSVAKTSTGRHAQGNIHWSKDGNRPESDERGYVRMSTTVSPVTLRI
ncbi:hypothetical protein R3P38DRAFT_2761011 [Favolaschia claudopus]|uniref:Adhesin domain-containing protein n=1 Tax=Favolaschia claudopus TaxID=2862362 RepID=A0AAW0DWK2_9AGAR